MGLRPIACWDCGFESRWGQRHLSLVSVVCCQVEVSETGRSLVQGSPIECVFVCVCVCHCYQVQQQPLHLQRVGSRHGTEKEDVAYVEIELGSLLTPESYTIQ
jgi:hypothetical protein